MSTALARQVVALIALLAVAYGGCSVGARPRGTQPTAAARAVPDSAGATPSDSAQPEPAPPPRSSVKSLLVSPIAEEPRGGRELISFSVKNVDIKDVLLGLSRMSNANIVFEPDIAGRVSVDLKDVTVDQALKDLLLPMGLEFTRDGRTIHVTKQKVQTRIFTLNYIPTRRKGMSQVFAKGGGTSTSSTTGGGTATAGAATSAGGATGGTESTGFTKVTSEDSANLWDDVKTTVERLLSPQGKYSINPMAGIVVVTDFPSQLDRIAQYFETVETAVRRQVLIQAELLEIILTEDFEYGINLAAPPRTETFRGTRPGITGVTQQRALISETLNLRRTGFFSIGIVDRVVSAALDLLQEEKKLRVLSRPSVLTLNGQKAVIKVATDDVFFVRSQTQVAETASTTTTETPQTVTLGVVLSVTPQISSDGYIMLDVHPSVTDSPRSRTSRSGDSEAPVVDVRETSTVLRVKDGESVVIAGLVKTKTDKRIRRVPILSRIPLLGALFQHLDESSENTELVIKITPRIIAGTTP